MPLLAEPTPRPSKLESPQEIVSLLEMRPNIGDLIDEVLHRVDPMFAQAGVDQSVISERDALMVDLPVASLVDELPDGLSCGVTE